MDSVTLDGKIYTKAKKAARVVGYASDYVGQLCRNGSIDARMIGKTWYVEEQSLRSHKEASRVKKNTVITRRDIHAHRSLENSTEGQAVTRGYSGYQPYLTETSIVYTPDESVLVPHPKVSTSEHNIPAQLIDDRAQESVVESGVLRSEATIPIRRITAADTESTKAVFHHEETEPFSSALDDSFLARVEKDSGMRTDSLKHISLPGIGGHIFLLLLSLFLLVSAILEGTWSYTSPSTPSYPVFYTSYHLTTLVSIRDTIRNLVSNITL